METITTILTNVESGQITLPDFQRGYVWKRKQVRDLFDSLYKGHPVGSLLTWKKKRNGVFVEELLDGQQRVSSLYGVIKGEPPKFFNGDSSALKSLHFHVLDEKFEFYQPIKMKDDPLWFDVTEVMQVGVGGIDDYIEDHLERNEQPIKNYPKIYGPLSRLLGVKDKNFHVEQITDNQKDIEEVVKIFNRLNSSGTKLSQGDLALATISSEWPNARKEMNKAVNQWNKERYKFKLDWLLRCVNAVIQGESAFKQLHNTDGSVFEAGLQRTVKYVDVVLNQISSRLGLDHHKVLFAQFSIAILVRHLELSKDRQISAEEWDLLMYWFLQAGMQGRSAGINDGMIKQHLMNVDGSLNGVNRLISEIGTIWGRPQILSSDFDAWSTGARNYPALYWLTCMGKAKDFCSGIVLNKYLIGKGSELHLHHIFPKSRLYEAGYNDRTQVNALGNFCFLTAACNQKIGAKCPRVSKACRPDSNDLDSRGYFYWVRDNYPNVLKSQWIPEDEELWKIENYPDFLKERRQLLANAANKFLKELNIDHPEPEIRNLQSDKLKLSVKIDSHIETLDEESQLQEVQEWMKSQQLPIGEFGFELAQSPDESGTIIDIAWPEGIRVGLDRPVALLLNETAETYKTVSQAGYDCFTDIDSFKKYI
ncbi:MAG: DUF262 domain-containing protein, partial [Bacteroidetes bacterium]|nr:DUF262 domain-containing protein [Bacteroidota bacterium]